MSELMWEGVDLMVMGMGTVFIFLAVLVIGTTLMSQIIMRLPANHEPEGSYSSGSKRPKTDDLTEVAAVAAAVKLFHER
jgi:oxaloacetate decarboxylase gamma subunit